MNNLLIIGREYVERRHDTVAISVHSIWCWKRNRYDLGQEPILAAIKSILVHHLVVELLLQISGFYWGQFWLYGLVLHFVFLYCLTSKVLFELNVGVHLLFGTHWAASDRLVSSFYCIPFGEHTLLELFMSILEFELHPIWYDADDELTLMINLQCIKF